MYVRTCICIYVYLCIYVHVYVYMYINVYINMYMSIYIYIKLITCLLQNIVDILKINYKNRGPCLLLFYILSLIVTFLPS